MIHEQQGRQSKSHEYTDSTFCLLKHNNNNKNRDCSGGGGDDTRKTRAISWAANLCRLAKQRHCAVASE